MTSETPDLPSDLTAFPSLSSSFFFRFSFFPSSFHSCLSSSFALLLPWSFIIPGSTQP